VSIVVDSSVVAQRLVAETDSSKARSLLLRWTEGSLDLLAPELLAVEIGNMLWKRAFRKLLPVEKVFELYREFQELQIPLWPSTHLVRPALRLAVQQGHPIYDCLYVALASETESELVTADERLFRTFGPVFHQIRLLRDWS
jgi:predicted nucleic acid-binding protein